VAVDWSFSDGVAIRSMCILMGFVDDVMFSCNGPIARRAFQYIAAIEHDKHNSRDSNQTLPNDKDRKYSHCELCTTVKVCYLPLPCSGGSFIELLLFNFNSVFVIVSASIYIGVAQALLARRCMSGAVVG